MCVFLWDALANRVLDIEDTSVEAMAEKFCLWLRWERGAGCDGWVGGGGDSDQCHATSTLSVRSEWGVETAAKVGAVVQGQFGSSLALSLAWLSSLQLAPATTWLAWNTFMPLAAVGMRGIILVKWRQPLLQKGPASGNCFIGWLSDSRNRMHATYLDICLPGRLCLNTDVCTIILVPCKPQLHHQPTHGRIGILHLS